MKCRSRIPIVALFVVVLGATASAQSEVRKRTIVVNGHTGEALVYRIDGRSFIELEALAQIGNGSLSFRGTEIHLTLPTAAAVPGAAATAAAESRMSTEFMAAAIRDLALIKDWHTTLAQAVQRGIPGDGSRLVVFRDRAAEGLRLATVAAANSADRNALQLLSNHFTQVDNWTRKLVQERKTMSTGKYAISNALDNDPEYQQIASCSEFLGKTLPGGQFEDNASCH